MGVSLEDILYRSGDVFLPKSIRSLLEKGVYFDNTQTFYINGWTGIHFLAGYISGIIYFKLDKPLDQYFLNMVMIHTLWELWQVFIGMAKPWRLSGPSNLIDTIVDTVAFMGGAYLVKIQNTNGYYY